MTISIHQPNFFPWYPFFQKIELADKFVILQNCQFEKNNFQNRFNKDGKWYTMSVNKGLEPIIEKKYVFFQRDWMNIKKGLPKYRKILDLFDDCLSENLSETNSNVILKIVDLLKIDTEIIFDYPTNLKSTERLVDISIKNNATTYLSGIVVQIYEFGLI